MRIKIFFLSLALSLIPHLIHAKELAGLYSGLQSLPTLQRIIKSTEYFIGNSTGINPLGEGEGIDANPTFSLKKFDCTTYVETNLAIAFSKSEADVYLVLNKIRYQGNAVNFFQRNHFMVSDWIPSNTKKGFVNEFTSQISQDKAAYRTDKKPLNKTTWFSHRVIDLLDQQKKSQKEILEQLAKVPTSSPQEEKSTYLLANYFRTHEKEMIEALPDISIIMFIRNIPSVPTLVNHMGFLIKKGGKLYLNHAPQAKPWHVQEVLLEDYLKDMDTHRAPVEGLLFLKIASH